MMEVWQEEAKLRFDAQKSKTDNSRTETCHTSSQAATGPDEIRQTFDSSEVELDEWERAGLE